MYFEKNNPTCNRAKGDGLMKNFKFFLLILALLGLLLCLSSCTRELKFIGVSLPDMPKEKGEHWDVGFGWNKNITPGWQNVKDWDSKM